MGDDIWRRFCFICLLTSLFARHATRISQLSAYVRRWEEKGPDESKRRIPHSTPTSSSSPHSFPHTQTQGEHPNRPIQADKGLSTEGNTREDRRRDPSSYTLAPLVSPHHLHHHPPQSFLSHHHIMGIRPLFRATKTQAQQLFRLVTNVDIRWVSVRKVCVAGYRQIHW